MTWRCDATSPGTESSNPLPPAKSLLTIGTDFRNLLEVLGSNGIIEMSEEDANCLIPAGWSLLTEPRCDGSG
jgi:hypothetical protein